MRQIFIVVPLFLLLLALLYLFIPVFPEKKSHESFIPADAQIVITQHDLKDRVAEFAASPLGKTLAQLRYEVVAGELGISAEELDRFFLLRDEIKRLYHNPLVQMLIGKEFSLALLPFAHQEYEDFVQGLADHLILVSRPRQSARLMDVATWVIAGDARISKVRYGAHDVTRFDLENGQRLSVARVKNRIILSLSERSLRISLDVYDNDRQGLRKNEQYRTKIDQFDGASLVGYFNLEGLAELINRAIFEFTPAGASFGQVDRKRIDPYQSVIFGAWREPNDIVDKAVISLDPEALDDSAKSMFFSQAALPDSYQRVSPDTVVYHWSNQFSLEALFGLSGYDQTGDTGGGQGTLLPDLSEITGMPTPQLFSLFDNEMTFAVRGLNEDQLVPLPSFLMSAQSTDTEQLREVVDRLIAHYSIPVRRKALDNAEIISWGGIVGIGSILPALSFTDGAVIVSSNRRQIRNYLDYQQKKSLADNPIFQDLQPHLLKPSQSITYVDFARTARMLQEMVSWGGTMLALKDRELARKSKVLIDDLINPLLEGLAMYAVIGSRKYHEGNAIVFESTTRLDNGTQQP